MENEYVNVSDLIFSINGIPFGCLQSGTINITRATKAITCQATGGIWDDAIAGKISWNLSVSGVQRWFTAAQITANSEVTQSKLFDSLVNGDKVEITYVSDKDGFVGSEYKGKALISGLTWERPTEDEATFSCELTGVGALVRTPAA